MNVNQTSLLPGEEYLTELLLTEQQQIPGSLHYSLTRYRVPQDGFVLEKGYIHYHYDISAAAAHKFELKFCITRNRYCALSDCNKCRLQAHDRYTEDIDTVDVFHFNFYPDFLSPFAQQNNAGKKSRVLSFRYPESFLKELPICNKKKNLLHKLQATSYCSALQNVTFNSVVQELLLCSCAALDESKPEIFSCKFLADSAGLEKMYAAREILLQNIDSLISIKELSRKVAINECYLKKGFKEVFGLTIYDFYMQQKMEHAKFLLYEEGMTVTDVAALLGYSSISHFSTAFKRQTGLKPCALLK